MFIEKPADPMIRVRIYVCYRISNPEVVEELLFAD